MEGTLALRSAASNAFQRSTGTPASTACAVTVSSEVPVIESTGPGEDHRLVHPDAR